MEQITKELQNFKLRGVQADTDPAEFKAEVDAHCQRLIAERVPLGPELFQRSLQQLVPWPVPELAASEEDYIDPETWTGYHRHFHQEDEATRRAHAFLQRRCVILLSDVARQFMRVFGVRGDKFLDYIGRFPQADVRYLAEANRQCALTKEILDANTGLWVIDTQSGMFMVLHARFRPWVAAIYAITQLPQAARDTPPSVWSEKRVEFSRHLLFVVKRLIAASPPSRVEELSE